MPRFQTSLMSAVAAATLLQVSAAAEPVTFSVTIDRGRDLGQAFGSLFEAHSADAALVFGAGFQNAYNTRYRADRHAVQFFIRPAGGTDKMAVEELPRPSRELVGAYLFGRDGTVYSTYGGLKSWDPGAQNWKTVRETGGTHETMRVGHSTLILGDSTVTCDGRTILEPPAVGSYQLFFYANGYLCFYHVNRQDRPYRPYRDDSDGFSRLYACPWTPDQSRVDLGSAATLRLPVVGETTFAWGQSGRQIVTGSNIGGFYIFEDGAWRMLLEPKLNVSYQLYASLAFHDRLLMGQYPAGRVFQFDGKSITDQKGWPPVLTGVSASAREAQTSVIYGGNLLVGVWPWGEVWSYHPGAEKWNFLQRMFEHPALSDQITHPYDFENRGNVPQNMWGQRVTSLVVNGPHLFISTSAKAPYEWKPGKYPFLAPEKWKSYGRVYRATLPGHLSAPTEWTSGPTTFEFIIRGHEIVIRQDGKRLASTTLTGSLTEQVDRLQGIRNVRWGDGIYGHTGGLSITGTVR